MERFERALEAAMERAETGTLTLARSSRRLAAR